MITLSRRVFLTLILFIQIFSYSLFLLGFFPLKQSLTTSAIIKNFTLGTHAISQPKKQFDKIVIVLIDALRSDFIYDEREQMPFLSEQIKQGHANSYIVLAHPPTVTLPRIKALTSGTIPGFVDVVVNLDSRSLTEDNLITQAIISGMQVVFYGDDTWIKLFPDHFSRSDGTTSFFVTDYTEVDDNVTRHIDAELSALDWDMMILHYLGLDHIGHTVGPRSPLVQPKLLEMDNIVQKIYESLVDKGEDFLLLVCGDHGMSDQGSHGGASDGEVLVPALFLSPAYKRQENSWKSQRNALQIDVAPTLSVLMGLPIPSNNLGQVLVGALDGFSDEEKLSIMYINTNQILKYLEKCVPDFEQESSYDLYLHAVDLHKSYLDQRESHSKTEILRILRSYELTMEAMSSKISGTLTTYDLYGMLVAMLLLTLSLVALFMSTLGNNQLLCFTQSPPTAIAITLLVIFVHVTSCTSQSFHSTSLCGRTFTSVAMQLTVFASIQFLVAAVSTYLQQQTNTKWFPKSSLTRLLCVGTIFHTLSFGSSSFVEEEHQTWYFLVMTFNLVALATQIRGHLALFSVKQYQINKFDATDSALSPKHWEKDLRNDELYEQIGVLIKNDRGESQHRKSNNHQIKSSEMLNHSGQILHDFDKINLNKSTPSLPWRYVLPWKQIAGIVTVMLLGRWLRTLNQTGNKWLDTPDMGDWLMMPQNKAVLSLLVFASNIVIVLVSGVEYNVEYACFVAGVFTCYIYRVTTGAVNSVLASTDTSNIIMSKGITEARIVFSLVLAINLITLINLRLLREQEGNRSFLALKSVKTLHLSWILLMTLLLRTPNTLLVAMVIVQERLLWRFVIKKIVIPFNYLAILCWWMGQSVFFQQGNSNSISTVDVSAGYVGLQDYQPVVVGLLLFFATYAGPIYWLLTLAKYILLIQIDRNSVKRKSEESYLPNEGSTRMGLLDCIQALLLERLSTLLLYCVVVTSQRYHLFVWTVFSPKLLYEGMLTILASLFSFIVLASV